MNEDDDDLPVLTQILRTGNVRPSPEDQAPTSVESRAAQHEAMSAEDTLMADQLVIGHDEHHEIEGYLTPSFHVSSADHAHEVHAEDDAHHAHQPDAFRLSQDHDGPHGARSGAFDEPEIATIAAPADAPQEDPAVFAERVRAAVLENLSARIETELDARVAQAVHAEVETALAQLQANLRSHVAEALRDVVGRAVDEEIARLRALPPDSA